MGGKVVGEGVRSSGLRSNFRPKMLDNCLKELRILDVRTGRILTDGVLKDYNTTRYCGVKQTKTTTTDLVTYSLHHKTDGLVRKGITYPHMITDTGLTKIQD